LSVKSYLKKCLSWSGILPRFFFLSKLNFPGTNMFYDTWHISHIYRMFCTRSREKVSRPSHRSFGLNISNFEPRQLCSFLWLCIRVQWFFKLAMPQVF
jgi:hypothetical protein